LIYSQSDTCGNHLEFWCTVGCFFYLFKDSQGNYLKAAQCEIPKGRNLAEIYYREVGDGFVFVGFLLFNCDPYSDMSRVYKFKDNFPSTYDWKEFRFDLCSKERQECKFFGESMPLLEKPPHIVPGRRSSGCLVFDAGSFEGDILGD
jgi:hypothetical protein